MASTIVPCPPAHGNQQHIYRLLCWLRDAGYEVILVLRPIDPFDEEAITQVAKLVYRLHVVRDQRTPRGGLAYLRAKGLEASDRITRQLKKRERRPPRLLRQLHVRKWEDIWCPPSLVDAVKACCRQYRPVAVIAQYIWTSRIFADLDPAIIKIVDTHDMFSTRADKVVAFGFEDPLAIDSQEEAELLGRADVVMTSQADEARGMRALGLTQHIFTIAIDMNVPEPFREQDEVPGRVLVVASNNMANVLSVQYLVERAWPQVLARHPGATLHICGRVSEHITAAGRNVTLCGYVPSVLDEYRQAQVVCNPVYCGSGLKIKSVEALGHGRALVAWPPGVEGFELDGVEPPWVVAHHWQQLAARIADLLERPELRRDLGRRGRQFIQERYRSEVIYRPLQEVLERGSPA